MKNILLLGLICCGILMSCYKDKGNYDYTVLPEVSIENLEDFYSKSQLDSIVLEPEMVTADGAYDENDWTYLWRLYPGKNVMDTIGYERVLRYQFTEEPGSYNIYFTAINKRTEVKYSKDIEINLSGVYMDGWMVLYEEDGNCDFDLLNDRFFSRYDQDEDIYFRHVYETVNGEPFPGNPVKIAPYYFPYTQYDYIISETEAARLSVNSMEKLQDVNNFVLGLENPKYENYFYIYYGAYRQGAEVLFSDGHIYLYSLGEDDGFAEPIAHDGLTYYAAPFASRNSKWTVVTVFYDQENCRFLEVQYQIFEVAEIVDSPTAKFSLNNMNADMVFMQDGFQKYEYAVMRDRTSGIYSLYVLDVADNESYAEAKYEMTQCPGIEDAISFAVGSRGEVFYYATPDQVYLYDYRTSNSAQNCIPSLQLEAGEEITCVRIFRPNEYNWMVNHPYDNKVLMVATYNANSGQGTLYMYYINESNGIVDEVSVKTVNVDGKVKDMGYHYSVYGS